MSDRLGDRARVWPHRGSQSAIGRAPFGYIAGRVFSDFGMNIMPISRIIANPEKVYVLVLEGAGAPNANTDRPKGQTTSNCSRRETMKTIFLAAVTAISLGTIGS